MEELKYDANNSKLMWVYIIINMIMTMVQGLCKLNICKKPHKDGKEVIFLHKSQLIESNGYKGDISHVSPLNIDA